MGLGSNLVTTKSRKMALPDGTKVEVNLARSMGKAWTWGGRPAWEKAMIARLQDIWALRGGPKYATFDGYGEGMDGFAIYENPPVYYTDGADASIMFAGFVRGSGRNLRFEKWERVMIPVPTYPKFEPDVLQRETSGKVAGMGCMVKQFYDVSDNNKWYVVVHAPNAAVLAEVKARLGIA